MTPDFISRIIGLIFFTILGSRFGQSIGESINITAESGGFILGLVGALIGLILTPWLTVRPIRNIRRFVMEMPIQRLILMLIGMICGLMVGLLLAYPFSLLFGSPNNIFPLFASLTLSYLGMTIFGVRYREILEILDEYFDIGGRVDGIGGRDLILDTSVLIDGRIVDIAETDFLGGVLIIPRFVLNELHRVADSSDPLRRQRGRRGLSLLNTLQRDDNVIVRIIDDDFDNIAEVDAKLVALCMQMRASLVTTDFNLNQVAEAQGVPVLNINRLANAVRPMYIPGQGFAVRVIQEGRDQNQGIGYLEDGTMIVIENGKKYLDRIIPVVVTKLINRDTGRMIFAVPESEANQYIIATDSDDE